MKYLSFDIEATGLDEHDLIIEFACVPFNCQDKTIENDLKFHTYVKCPSFETLKPQLNEWVIEHNKELIETAHSKGVELTEFKTSFEKYLKSKAFTNYFSTQSHDSKPILFGKSMNAIDLPFLNRDLGYNFLRDYFSHRVLDLTSVTMSFCDLKLLPSECVSGSNIMRYFSMGEVAHTALDDAINTAKLYFKMLELLDAESTN